MTQMRNLAQSICWGINAQSGTTYTLAITDGGKIIPCTNSSPITVTIPPASSVKFYDGDRIELEQGGAGAITVAPGAGVTIRSAGPLVTAAQYSRVILTYKGSDVWNVDVRFPSNIIARDHTELNINTSNTKTTLYTFTLPANSLGTDKTLALEMAGKYQNNSGSNCTLTIEVKLGGIGGTVLFADVTANQTTQTTERPWFFLLRIAAKGATNAQTIDGLLNLGTAAGATTGIGDLAAVIANGTGFDTAIYGTAAEDSTTNLAVTVSITHSVSNAAILIKRERADAFMLGEGMKGDTGATGAAGAAGAGTVTVPVNNQTGTTYTLVGTDLGKKVRCANASSIVVTIPNGVFSVGDVGYVLQSGAGTVTLASDGTSVLNKPHTLTIGARYAQLTWHLVDRTGGVDTFDISGEST